MTNQLPQANRNLLLNSIRRHLQVSRSEAGEVRPLGEIVPRVAFEFRELVIGSPHTSGLEAWELAAFVDGQLGEEADESICQAVLTDHRLLAELIACVRASIEFESGLDPLSPQLASRLESLVSKELSSLKTETISADELIPALLVESASQASHEDSLSSHEIEVTPSFPVKSTNARARRRLLAIAIAASLFIAAYLGYQLVPDPGNTKAIAELGPPQSVIETSTEGQANSPPSDTENDRDLPQDKPLLATELVPDTRLTNPVASISADSTQSDLANPPRAAPGTADESVSLAASEETSDPKVQTKVDVGPQPAELEGFRWTKIQGLLAQREPANSNVGVNADGQPSSFSYADEYAAESWARIDQPSVEIEDGVAIRDEISFKTLPNSKAEAAFSSGGRLVMAADTGFKFLRNTANASASLELQHGGLAMMNFPSGTIIRLFGMDKFLSQMHWQSKASVILEYTGEGLQVHVRGGSIELNDQRITNRSVVIGADASPVEIEKLKRLPRWINGSVPTIPNHILAQLDTSVDLNHAIQRRITLLEAAPASSPDHSSLLVLTQLRAAIAGDNLWRLTASPNPLIRMAAVQRLVDMPSWDPRFDRIWIKANQGLIDHQRAKLIQQYIVRLQQGARFGPTEVDSLLEGLDSPDAALRVIHDFMLRRALNGGPSFEFNPSWAQQNRARAIRAWRSFAGRMARMRAATNQTRPDVP